MEKERRDLKVSSRVPPNHKFNMDQLISRVEHFSAGNIRNNYEAWKKLTSDRNILSIVHVGLKLEFTNLPPEKAPFEYPRGKKEYDIIDNEISQLLRKGVVEYCHSEEGEYFSNLFTTSKKDGSFRTILNLKYLNLECDKTHFKMESLKQALHMIRPGTYLGSIDIKDAFYSVPIHESHKKYLKFMWKGDMLQFRAMPNGYCDAMRVFTKLLKPVFATLRELGYESVIYVDDSLLQGDTFEECLRNIQVTLKCLQELGFVVHPTKSVLYPTQVITFLGFIIDTVNMTITLTDEKKMKIRERGLGLINGENVTVRMVSSFIGNLTASFEAVPFGKLYYRNLEFCKSQALKSNRFDFDAPCTISDKGIREINWWIENIMNSFAYIEAIPEIDHVIHTDASKHLGGGWGASDGCHDDINGRWSLHEQNLDINCLELKAVKLAIQSYAPLYRVCKHIRIMSDNTSAIAYINKQGGTKCMTQNDLSVKIWEYAMENGIHISAAHIPGKHNILADEASRKFQDAAEWKIPKCTFKSLVRAFGKPDIDLFASRLNHQLPTYVSWLPDPGSTYIDAMTISWSGKYIYAFPPFSMIWPMLSKIVQERVERALIVIPKWPTQSWYTLMLKLRLRQHPIMTISSSRLTLPGTKMTHPLAPKLKLLAVLVSGCRN